MTSPTLSAENLSLAYQSKVVLNRISLQVPPGKLSVLLGPNGSGKSTLLRCLSGNLPVNSGSVLLENRPLPAYSARQIAQQLAYVPQENPMPFAFTVQEIVDLGTKTPASRTSAIEQMELEKFLHRSVVTLSGGERQRAAIARALAQETPLLLMDEPTTHLDIRHQLILLEVLKERVRCQGTTVLLVLHDLTFSAHHADYLFLLSEGELVAQGTPNDVLTIQTIAQVYRVETTIKIDQNNKKIDIFPLRSV